jgi:hypothetical protein
MPSCPLPVPPCPPSRVCVIGAHGKALALALASPCPQMPSGQQISPRTIPEAAGCVVTPVHVGWRVSARPA